MKTSTLLLFVLLPITTFSQEVEGLANQKVQTIAFGSCSKQDLADRQLWKEIAQENPDLWIWLGDNIYGDSEDMMVLEKKYDQQKAHPDYQALIKKTSIIGIWDDHDYGVNDGGKEFSKKDESRDLLFGFLDLDKKHPAWNRKGAYQAHTYDFNGKRIKVILLDARYFRDPLKKDSKGRNAPNQAGNVLGQTQWDWLAKQLDDAATDFFIIGSGIQVLAKDHPYEKWANFPDERNKLLSMVREVAKAPVLFISGDRHISELSKLSTENYTYPIYDATSSSLTHGWSERAEEKNELRTGNIVYNENFAVLNIDWSEGPPKTFLKYVGKDNKVLQEFELIY